MNFKQWLNESGWEAFGKGGHSDENLQKYIDVANLRRRGMTLDQIALRHGVSVGTIRKWMLLSMHDAREGPPKFDDEFYNWPDTKATVMSQMDEPLSFNQLERGKRRLKSLRDEHPEEFIQRNRQIRDKIQ